MLIPSTNDSSLFFSILFRRLKKYHIWICGSLILNGIIISKYLKIKKRPILEFFQLTLLERKKMRKNICITREQTRGHKWIKLCMKLAQVVLKINIASFLFSTHATHWSSNQVIHTFLHMSCIKLFFACHLFLSERILSNSTKNFPVSVWKKRNFCLLFSSIPFVNFFFFWMKTDEKWKYALW